MFIPGETISHRFIIPVVERDIVKILVTYRQNGHIVLEKTVRINEVELLPDGGGQFTVILSQEESLLFDDNAEFYVQLNVVFPSVRCASIELKGTNLRQHYREVVS